jgi:hypothetical protein
MEGSGWWGNGSPLETPNASQSSQRQKRNRSPIGRKVVTNLGTLEVVAEREVNQISQIADNVTVTRWAVSSAG